MKLGFVNGCFDVLHVGHIALFNFCKSFCDYLIVGIDSDERVNAHKGSNRPFNTSVDRVTMLGSIRYIDEVRVFSTDSELIQLIKEVSPDVMVVGSDWEGKNVIGSEHAKELKFFRRMNGYSTTKILESSIDR